MHIALKLFRYSVFSYFIPTLKIGEIEVIIYIYIIKFSLQMRTCKIIFLNTEYLNTASKRVSGNLFTHATSEAVSTKSILRVSEWAEIYLRTLRAKQYSIHRER